MERDLVELIERARQGDRTAYDAVVRRKVETVYRTARAILGNDADADDAAQESFLVAWRQLGRLREADRFDAWLSRITVNACRMALRRRRGRAAASIGAGAANRATDAGTSGFEGRVVNADAFDRAFDRLPVDQRALLVFLYRDDLSIAEIAARLGVAEGTIKSRLHTARAALDRAMVREGAW